MRILLVEDNQKLLSNLTKILKLAHYSVDSLNDPVEARDIALGSEYDLIILDVMMPGMSGFELAQGLRQEKNTTPILFLTAKTDTASKVEGLDLGADDYLTKPFEVDELLARVRVLTRKNNQQRGSNIKIGRVKLVLGTKEVFVDTQKIQLSAKEWQVLEYLALNQGRLINESQLLDHCWDESYQGMSNVVSATIKGIRNKLKAVNCQNLIETKRGFGYTINQENHV